jgi:hypothetical protein
MTDTAYRPREVYKQTIAYASELGLPTKFLEAVLSQYSIRETSNVNTDFTEPKMNNMYLKADTIETLENLEKLKTWSPEASRALDSIYHESTHAYMAMMKNSPEFQEMISRGRAYYVRAPLQEGLFTAKNPERVFQEAVGEYVGNRVFIWWSAYGLVLLAISKAGEMPERAANLLQKARTEYDESAAKRVFGYEEQGLFSRERHTSKGLSDELKTFLDSGILEGKLPDRFDDIALFKKLLRDANVPMPAPAPVKSRPTHDNLEIHVPLDLPAPATPKRSRCLFSLPSRPLGAADLTDPTNPLRQVMDAQQRRFMEDNLKHIREITAAAGKSISAASASTPPHVTSGGPSRTSPVGQTGLPPHGTWPRDPISRGNQGPPPGVLGPLPHGPGPSRPDPITKPLSPGGHTQTTVTIGPITSLIYYTPGAPRVLPPPL